MHLVVPTFTSSRTSLLATNTASVFIEKISHFEGLSNPYHLNFVIFSFEWKLTCCGSSAEGAQRGSYHEIYPSDPLPSFFATRHKFRKF
jgi:hypothetical protein